MMQYLHGHRVAKPSFLTAEARSRGRGDRPSSWDGTLEPGREDPLGPLERHRASTRGCIAGAASRHFDGQLRDHIVERIDSKGVGLPSGRRYTRVSLSYTTSSAGPSPSEPITPGPRPIGANVGVVGCAGGGGDSRGVVHGGHERRKDDERDQDEEDQHRLEEIAGRLSRGEGRIEGEGEA